MPRPKKEQPNRADGRYEVKITIGKDFNGELIRKSFYSNISKSDAKAQAEEYIVNQKVSNQIGVGLIDANINFSKWADVWLETYKKGKVKDSTYLNNCLNVVNIHLKPFFGASDLISIKPVNVQAFFDSKRSEGCALESMKKMRVCLNSIFDTAIENDLCYKNPVTKNIVLISDKKPAIKRSYTKSQHKTIMKYAKSHPNGLPIMLMLLTGITRSELLGLKWNCVDLENGIIEINQGTTLVKNSKTNTWGISVDDPKNEFRHRLIPINSELVALLKNKFDNREVIVGRNKSKKIKGTVVIPEFVFSNSKGEVFDPTNWTSRVYNKFMKDLQAKYPQIPILSAHELRHTFATLTKDSNADLFVLSKIMGHSDLKMLYERYAHTDVDQMRKALGFKIKGDDSLTT